MLLLVAFHVLGAACNPNSRATFKYALRVHGMETAELITITCQLPAVPIAQSHANMFDSWIMFHVVQISVISVIFRLIEL